MSYPTGEREQHEDQITPEHLDRQNSYTPEYPAKLVELTATEHRSPTQNQYFMYQQSDRYGEQATGEGFAELVPLRPQLKPVSAPGQAVQVSGFQGRPEGCPVEETSHDQGREVKHTCTVLEQGQVVSRCYPPNNRQVLNVSVSQVTSLGMINTKLGR